MNNSKFNSLGKILVKARKSLNLSQKDISKKLCLKLDIIKNIEKDILYSNIPPVFLYGYIYSYARLVNIPKKKIFFFLKKYKIENYINNNFINENSYFKIFKNFLFIKIFNIIKFFIFFILGFIYFYNI